MLISPVFGPISLFYVLLALLTYISTSAIVYKDAQNLGQPALSIQPIIWLGIALSLPIIGMFIYWLMNYSSLAKTY